MAVYPIKMMKDESGQPFVPLTSLDAVIGEKNLQYILDAEELSAGHFRVNFKDLGMKDITNSIIVVRWPQITSTVKPSYLKLNNNTEAILYNGTGKEYMDLEDASGTINLLAYDGTKWIQATGSGSGGGHVITNGEGHSMEQQKVLNFVGFNVENDAANRATKIVNPTPINNLTTTESGQGSLDAYQGNILSKRSVPTGGTKGQVLAKSGNGDHQLEWINQDSDDVITSNGSIEEIIGLTYEEYQALEAEGQLKPTTQYHITDMSNAVGGLTEASMVEFYDGTNLEDRMSAKDIVDNGQNSRLDVVEGNIDSFVSGFNSLSNEVADLQKIVYFAGFRNDSGDTEFTGPISINNVVHNLGNGYDTATGYFKAPVKGIYTVTASWYSNDTTSLSRRPGILVIPVSGNHVHYMCATMASGSVTHNVYLQAGDKVTFGAYSAGFPINFYAAEGHNYFTVLLIKEIQ
jgi:hypothetical protein